MNEHDTRHRRFGDRGSVLVEAALVLPLVFALLLGMATAGIAIYHKNTLNNSVREAARFGATVPQSQCDVASNCSGLTWAQLVQSVGVSRSDGLLTATDVCVALVTGPGSAPTAVDASHTTAGGTSPCYADQSADTTTRVQVTGTRSDGVEFVFFSKTVNEVGRAAAKFG